MAPDAETNYGLHQLADYPYDKSLSYEPITKLKDITVEECVCFLVGFLYPELKRDWESHLTQFGKNCSWESDYRFYKERIRLMHDFPGFKKPRIDSWVQQTRKRIDEAIAEDSAFSFGVIVGQLQEDEIYEVENVSCEEQNRRTLTLYNDRRTARLALLYSLIQNKPKWMQTSPIKTHISRAWDVVQEPPRVITSELVSRLAKNVLPKLTDEYDWQQVFWELQEGYEWPNGDEMDCLKFFPEKQTKAEQMKTLENIRRNEFRNNPGLKRITKDLRTSEVEEWLDSFKESLQAAIRFQHLVTPHKLFREMVYSLSPLRTTVSVEHHQHFENYVAAELWRDYLYGRFTLSFAASSHYSHIDRQEVHLRATEQNENAIQIFFSGHKILLNTSPLTIEFKGLIGRPKHAQVLRELAESHPEPVHSERLINKFWNGKNSSDNPEIELCSIITELRGFFKIGEDKFGKILLPRKSGGYYALHRETQIAKPGKDSR